MKNEMLTDEPIRQYTPPYKKTKYYSNQLYRMYTTIWHKNGKTEDILIGYIRIPDRENITMDLMPYMNVLDLPIFAWYNYSTKGQLHFKGEAIYDWICNRVTPSNRQGIHELLMDVGITEYDAVSLFVWANGKFSNDQLHIELCDESKEDTYKKLMKVDRFVPDERSELPPWFR